MIRAVAWFSIEHCGVVTPLPATSWTRPASAYVEPDAVAKLVGGPVKYYSRMTPETRACVIASGLARSAAAWDAGIEVGLLSAGDDGSRHANERYFRDYVASGRSMGRGNLFIYTLPTSTLGEVAIALRTQGPSMYLHEATQPLSTLVQQAQQLIGDGEAAAMLALWSDERAAVCLAIDGDPDDPRLYPFLRDGTRPSPLALAQRMRATLL